MTPNLYVTYSNSKLRNLKLSDAARFFEEVRIPYVYSLMHRKNYYNVSEKSFARILTKVTKGDYKSYYLIVTYNFIAKTPDYVYRNIENIRNTFERKGLEEIYMSITEHTDLSCEYILIKKADIPIVGTKRLVDFYVRKENEALGEGRLPLPPLDEMDYIFYKKKAKIHCIYLSTP